MHLRKSLAVLLAVGLINIMALGVINSGAWFTAGATVPVSAAAGHLNLTLSGPAAQGMVLKDLAPADDDWVKPFFQDVTVKADATMDIKLKLSAVKVSETVPGFFDKLNVRVFKCGQAPCDTMWWVHYQPLYVGKVANLSITDLNMDPGESNCYHFEFQLDKTAGNVFQKAEAKLNIVFSATQKDNPGWSE